MSHALEVGADEVEVTEEAEQTWVAALDEGIGAFLGNPDCTPGYYNNEGGPIGSASASTRRLPRRPGRLLPLHRRLAESGAFEGLEFRAADSRWARMVGTS